MSDGRTRKSSAALADPETICVHLRRRARDLDYTITSFARALGVSRTTLHDIFRGKRRFTVRMAERLNALDPEYSVTPLWAIRNRLAPTRKAPPRLNSREGKKFSDLPQPKE